MQINKASCPTPPLVVPGLPCFVLPSFTTNGKVEESYRDYHKTAFAAAAIHPSEVFREASRVRVAVCTLIGLRPSAENTSPLGPEGDNGGRGGLTMAKEEGEAKGPEAGEDCKTTVESGGANKEGQEEKDIRV